MSLEPLDERTEPIETPPDPAPWSPGDTVEDSQHRKAYRVQRLLALGRLSLPYRFYEVTEVAIGEADDPPEAGAPGLLEKGTGEGAPGATPYWLWEAFSPEGISALEREAEVLASLDLPMFPRVYAHFQQGGRAFLVTETLPEKTLAEVLEGQDWSLEQLLGVLAQASYALAKLHERGWVHLGLRPQSVLMGRPIKLVDFRWAKRVGEPISTPFYLPGYSPPELLKGEEVADGRADIFAVGALLYRALEGRSLPETGLDPEWRPPYPGVPQVLSRCLGPQEARYPRMEDLHRDLLRLREQYAPTLAYRVASATTIGLDPTRPTNQDAYGYLEGRLEGEGEGEKWLFACVADGMGGMEAGEAASVSAVRKAMAKASSFLGASRGLTAEEQAEILKQWVQEANEEVCAVLERRGVQGGTTLLCALALGERLAIAHVGDCRLYLARGEELRLLTRDHSLAMALALQEGQVDMEAIRQSPDRSRLTRSLGERSPLPPYFIDTLATTTGKATMELQEGDVLVLCTDGLWEPVTEGEMVSILQGHGSDLQQAAEALLALALQRGGPDNATVLLVQVQRRPSPFGKGKGGDAHVERGGEAPSDPLEGPHP